MKRLLNEDATSPEVWEEVERWKRRYWDQLGCAFQASILMKLLQDTLMETYTEMEEMNRELSWNEYESVSRDAWGAH
jgi:hypothetical protein